MLLYYTGTSRISATIINEQSNNTRSGNMSAIEAMHLIKKSSVDMKEAVLKGDIKNFASIIGDAWENKKKMASSISNNKIDGIIETAKLAGAISGKVSGAGGGGFIMFVVDPINKVQVQNALNKLKGRIVNFQFSEGGCHGWKIY